jgi:DNA-binding transcriptional LysR family regulator
MWAYSGIVIILMNIYHIFVTVVKLGSFSSAAKELHRSPSSISKKMSLLEERLNVQLFDRTTRNLAVTEAGRLYYERCQDIAQRINEAESELGGLSEEPSGTIRVTWPHTVSTSNVVDTIADFCEAHPSIKIDVNINNDRVNLIDENIDFAFRMDTLSDSSMVALELMKFEPVICASPAYVSRHGMLGCLEDIADMPLLLLNYPSAIQNHWKTLPGLKGLDIAAHNRVNDINALYKMVKKGMGATLIARHMIEQDLKDGTLIDLLPEHSFGGQPVYLMYHRYRFMPKKLTLFIDYFKDRYRR